MTREGGGGAREPLSALRPPPSPLPQPTATSDSTVSGK